MRKSDPIEKLSKIVETNFRLNQLSQRETAAKVATLSSGLKSVSSNLETVTRTLGMVVKTLENVTGTVEFLSDSAASLATEQELMADRMEEAIQALRGLGTGNSEIRQEIVDIKARLDRLEDRAS